MEGHPGRDSLVVVAASAGGLMPLRQLLAELPADLPASVLAVLHIPPTGGQALPRILDRSGPLAAAAATDGARLAPGRVYVAPPDRHLLVVNGAIRLSRGPRQNGVRPAADPMFRSAALYAGPRTIAVVLSGTLDDAARGCAAVEQRGGRVAVQDPSEAAYPGMPESALAATRHAVALPVSDLARLITRLAGEDPAPPDGGPAPELEAEVSRLLNGDLEADMSARPYSGFICPDCGGPLYYGRQDTASAYECMVGHGWSPQSLFDEHSVAMEKAMWLAIRSLDERGRLTRRLAEEAEERGRRLSVARFRATAEEACRAADQLRTIVSGLGAVGHGLGDPSEPGAATPIG
jgi:two-component system chemotaxis response regulator CheB